MMPTRVASIQGAWSALIRPPDTKPDKYCCTKSCVAASYMPPSLKAAKKASRGNMSNRNFMARLYTGLIRIILGMA
ncbi:hypothetical protein D3C81_1662470 [compost metagenome]